MSANKIIIHTQGAEDTKKVGASVGKFLDTGDLVAFKGDLGAGKTCMIKGIAKGLQVPENCYVRSPSFVILNIYPGRCSLYHLDLYRIHDPLELEDLGYRDFFFGDAVTVVEWADKFSGFLPEDHLKISLDFQSETQRKITIEAQGACFDGRWEAFCRTLTIDHQS